MRRAPASARRLSLLALALALALASASCSSLRLYAKDLMDPRESAAVTLPVKVAVALFVMPPTIAWLPISGPVLLALHDENAIWFALAPGLVLGGPLVLLAGAPGYLVTDRPPAGEDEVAPIVSAR